MTYEEMQKSHNDLNIVELDLSEVSGLKGFYYAGNIAIEKKTFIYRKILCSC